MDLSPRPTFLASVGASVTVGTTMASGVRGLVLLGVVRSVSFVVFVVVS